MTNTRHDRVDSPLSGRPKGYNLTSTWVKTTQSDPTSAEAGTSSASARSNSRSSIIEWRPSSTSAWNDRSIPALLARTSWVSPRSARN